LDPTGGRTGPQVTLAQPAVKPPYDAESAVRHVRPIFGDALDQLDHVALSNVVDALTAPRRQREVTNDMVLLLPACRTQSLGLPIEKRLSVLRDGIGSSISLGLPVLELLALLVLARIDTLINRVTRLGHADARCAHWHRRGSPGCQLGGLAAVRPPVARNPRLRTARKDGKPQARRAVHNLEIFRFRPDRPDG